MKIFDIDVSGEDLLNKDYTICVSDNDKIIKGFKFSEEIISILSSKFGQGIYRYSKSKGGKADFKVRVYCIIIYYLFRSINYQGESSLKVCRDFDGRENDISANLEFFLKNLLGMRISGGINFTRLDKESNAHNYAYLMRKDKKYQLPNFVKISLEDIEIWLK